MKRAKNSLTINGVTFTPNSDGTVVANGTAGTGNSEYFIVKNISIPAGTYIISGADSNRGNKTYYMRIGDGETNAFITNDSAGIFTAVDGKTYNVSIAIVNNYQANNVIFKPMLRSIDIEDDAYEPYVADLQEQIKQVNEQAILNKNSIGLQCKNLLKNTAQSNIVNGVTFTVQKDGSVETSGTATNDTIFTLREWTEVPQYLKNVSLRVTGCPQNGALDGYRIAVHGKKTSGDLYVGLGADIGDGVVVDLSNQLMCRVIIRIGANTNVDGLIFYPMIRSAEITDDTYEPYQSSLQEQITGLSSAMIYRGHFSVNEDFNEKIEPGYYSYAGGPINKPGGGLDYGLLLVISAHNYVVQVVFSYIGDSLGDHPLRSIYERESINNGDTFSTWRKLSLVSII